MSKDNHHREYHSGSDVCLQLLYLSKVCKDEVEALSHALARISVPRMI